MELDDPVPWEKVEASFETQVKCLTDFVLTMVRAADLAQARFYEERLRAWEELRDSVRDIYQRRQMTYGELREISKTHIPPPYEGPRPTAWEKLLDGVE